MKKERPRRRKDEEEEQSPVAHMLQYVGEGSCREADHCKSPDQTPATHSNSSLNVMFVSSDVDDVIRNV